MSIEKPVENTIIASLVSYISHSATKHICYTGSMREKKSKARRQYEAFLQKGTCPICQWQSKRVTAEGRQWHLFYHLSDEHADRDDRDAIIDRVVSQQNV
jgi:hypothetical protein